MTVRFYIGYYRGYEVASVRVAKERRESNSQRDIGVAITHTIFKEKKEFLLVSQYYLY